MHAEDDGTLSRVLCGRIAALALVTCSILLMVSDLAVPGRHSLPALLISCGASLAVGLVAWWFPWGRFGRWTVLAVIPFAFAAVGMTWVFAARNAFNYSVTFVVIFALVGLALPRWTALKLAPLLAVAYLLPLLATPGRVSSIGLGSAIFVVPMCVVLAEAIAWGMHRFAVAEGEVVKGAASNQQLFDEAPIDISKLGLDGRLLEVNRAYAEIHGYGREQMVGMAVLDLTHPDDREDGRIHIERLLSGERDRFHTERRSIRSDGRIAWVSPRVSRCT